jgi:hypothetical protein
LEFIHGRSRFEKFALQFLAIGGFARSNLGHGVVRPPSPSSF